MFNYYIELNRTNFTFGPQYNLYIFNKNGELVASKVLDRKTGRAVMLKLEKRFNRPAVLETNMFCNTISNSIIRGYV